MGRKGHLDKNLNYGLVGAGGGEASLAVLRASGGASSQVKNVDRAEKAQFQEIMRPVSKKSGSFFSFSIFAETRDDAR